MSDDGRIPVTVITGFLGAGKTTVLNHIINGVRDRRIAVLVNDFGEINIDAQLVTAVDGETFALSGGCMCCTIREDLVETMLQVVDRDDPPEHVVVETSGVSDPHAVTRAFQHPDLGHLIAMDGVATVIDAEQVRTLAPTSRVVVEQIHAADVVILNKIDLVGDAERTEVRGWIAGHVPHARVLEASYGRVPLSLLLGMSSMERARDGAAGHIHDHDLDHDHVGEFASWTYAVDRALDVGGLRRAASALPTGVIRAKGLFRVAGRPQHRGVLHVVGKRATVTDYDPWGSLPPRTQLVFIGTPGGFDPAALGAALAACEVDA